MFNILLLLLITISSTKTYEIKINHIPLHTNNIFNTKPVEPSHHDVRSNNVHYYSYYPISIYIL
jgi:hypothetical protein